MQVLFAAIDKADSTEPEAVAEALSGLSMRTIVGQVTVRPEDNQIVRGNFFGQVMEREGVLRPVISTTVDASVAMPAADKNCRL
jgi:hypothetical protein